MIDSDYGNIMVHRVEQTSIIENSRKEKDLKNKQKQSEDKNKDKKEDNFGEILKKEMEKII